MLRNTEGQIAIRGLQIIILALLIIMIGISVATLTLVAIGAVQFNLDSFLNYFLSTIK